MLDYAGPMGLLDRFRDLRGKVGDALGADAPDTPEVPDALVQDLPLRPESRRLTDEERETVRAGLAALEADGVDVDDLTSIGAGLDRALAGWLESAGSDHDEIVDRYAVAVGEHLDRHTDLAWEIVTDVFGTDLAVAAGDFVVVPSNLVAVRWMRRETGWVPGVVGHLVRLRQR